MSSDNDKGAPAHRGRSLLAALVADPARFGTDVWGRAALHTPAAELPGEARTLFSAAAVDELVSVRGLRTPFLRMARNGATLAERDFTAPGGVGASIGDQLSDDKLLRQFADGATMVLQGLHRTWEPLIDFSQGLAGELGHPVQINGYVTPPQSRGFDDHYDVHDVFVLQVTGRKRWCIRPPVHVWPLRNQPWTERRESIAEAAHAPPELDVVLAPGDTLYLPRGWLHSATALGEVSTHLTIGVHTWTRHHLLDQVVAEAVAVLERDPAVRAALHMGADVRAPADIDDDVAIVRERLLAAVGEVSATDVAGRLEVPVRSTQRGSPLRPLAQLAAADTLTETDTLRPREHLDLAVSERPGDRMLLRSRAGELTLTGAEWTLARGMLRGAPASAEALGLPLARTLLLAGLAVVVERL